MRTCYKVTAKFGQSLGFKRHTKGQCKTPGVPPLWQLLPRSVSFLSSKLKGICYVKKCIVGCHAWSCMCSEFVQEATLRRVLCNSPHGNAFATHSVTEWSIIGLGFQFGVVLFQRTMIIPFFLQKAYQHIADACSLTIYTWSYDREKRYNNMQLQLVTHTNKTNPCIRDLTYEYPPKLDLKTNTMFHTPTFKGSTCMTMVHSVGFRLWVGYGLR